jgi:tRNA-uridine 2-sulfurtransferase
MDVKGKKIYVGLSGGVDSAVSAALLEQAGALVTGVFIKGWYPPDVPCTWAADRRDAMLVAARLRIPFETLDARAEYKKGVIDYLLSEYRAGRTPNPDVMCNKEVKFGKFYQFAKAAGADAIATGHYRSGEKDQSYFLWAVPKEVLNETIFPVGKYEKDVVRALAKQFKLPVAEKKDSQGICFLGNISVEEFLQKEFEISPGRVLDTEGRAVGMHNGALLHTLGARINVEGARESGPWFVLAKDIAKNELIVGKSRVPEGNAQSQKISFEHSNWFGSPEGELEAQYRYRGPRIPGHIEGDTFTPSVSLPEIPAPGQSIVFYRNAELMGGGIIYL